MNIKTKFWKHSISFLVLNLFVLCQVLAQVQTVPVTGVVLDEQQEPLIGVSVSIKGSSIGTITNIDGEFSLSVEPGATLDFSYVGYEPGELLINQSGYYRIVMRENTNDLEEVVVIGYGQVRKGDVTGSLSSIKTDELNRGLQIRPEEALIGKVAGVNITPNSGAPGEGGTIRIRMGASLKATNDPLIVIDGVPVESNALNSLSPNDIESFTVLKDASATAIYGSRASNGVIVVTTKKGVYGLDKPKISYSGNFSSGTVSKKYRVLSADEFRSALNEYVDLPETFNRGSVDTSWQDEVFRNAFGMDHNISILGSSKIMPYRISVGYLNQNGTLKNNNYQRYNGSISLSPSFFDKHLNFDLNVLGSISRNKSVSSSIIGGAISFDPTRPVYENLPNNMGLGYFMWVNSAGEPINLAPLNPLSELMLPKKMEQNNQSIGNLATKYKVHGFSELEFNLNLGYDIRKRSTNSMIPQNAPSMFTGNQYDGTGLKNRNNSLNKNTLLTSYANYVKDINENHSLNAMVGYEWQHFWFSSSSDKATDLAGKPFDNTVQTTNKGELYLLSFFGRLNYNFRQNLSLTGTLRSDGSSRFSKKNRWGYFPSAALAYRISDEALFKNIEVLSDLKFRLSYGQTGQQDIGGYYVSQLDYTISYDNAQYLFGDQWYSLYRPNGADPNIKWETTSTYNFGLDYGFIKNRVNGSIDIFTRRTKDLLNRITVPAGSNFTSEVDTNIGSMKSNGIEFGLTAIPITTKDIEWSISGNFTYNKSTITKLTIMDDSETMIKVGNVQDTRNFLQVHTIGKTPNSFFLLKQAYDENGKPLDGQYIAKDGSITTNDSDTEKYILDKSSKVPFYYGLSSKLIFKNWDMGINGHGSFGNYIYNYQQSNFSLENLYNAQAISSNITPETLRNKFKQSRHYTDYFLESGAFFKIDNITLGYTLKSRTWCQSMRMAFTLQNVATFTKYTGLDPEVYTGLDKNTYAHPRTYTLSLNINF